MAQDIHNVRLQRFHCRLGLTLGERAIKPHHSIARGRRGPKAQLRKRLDAHGDMHAASRSQGSQGRGVGRTAFAIGRVDRTDQERIVTRRRSFLDREIGYTHLR
jgi:hypothetical protein